MALFFGDNTGNDFQVGLTPGLTGNNDIVFSGDGNDTVDVSASGNNTNLFTGNDNDLIFVGTGTIALGGTGDDTIFAVAGSGNNRLYGGDGNDTFFLGSNDRVFGGTGNDTIFASNNQNNIISSGSGLDSLVFSGDPFSGQNVSDPTRQIIGNESAIVDFDFINDKYSFSGSDLGIVGGVVNFAAVDANAPIGTIPNGTNVVVLLNSDNDNNPNTPFLAGTAASQIAGLVTTSAPGLFVYYNSDLGLNRLVYSSDLSSATADLKIIARQTDLIGQDAINALSSFSATNFEFV